MFKRVKILYFIAWLIFAIFFLVEFTLRVSPSVMTSSLMQAFSIKAQGIGIITASYYIAYVLMQLPAGHLLDRYNLTKVMVVAAAIIALGCAIFAEAHSYSLAIVARFIMGAGAAFILLGCLKAISLYFKPKRHGLYVGLTGMLCAVGGVQGQTLLAYLVKQTGWHNTILIMMVIILLIMAAIWFCTPRHDPKHLETHAPVLDTLRKYLVNANYLRLVIFAGLLNSPIVAFAGLWAVPYFSITEHTTNFAASTITAWVWVGQIPGYLLINWLSDYIRARRIMMFSAALASIAMLYILFAGIHSLTALSIAMFTLGFFCSANYLAFTQICKMCDTRESGILNSIAVIINIGIGTIMQIVIGILANHTIAHAHLVHGHSLSNAQLNKLLIMLPIGLLLAVIVASRTHFQCTAR